jgi:hypothetical protein
MAELIAKSEFEGTMKGAGKEVGKKYSFCYCNISLLIFVMKVFS